MFQDIDRGGYQTAGSSASDDPTLWVAGESGLGVSATFTRSDKQQAAQTRVFLAGIAASAAASTLIWLAELLFGPGRTPIIRRRRRQASAAANTNASANED